jgi:hypothetical protein
MNSTTTQPNLLELAKQGNAHAIATLMNRQLQPKGITTKTTLTQGCLMIIAESEDIPEQTFLVDFLRKGITNLMAEGIQRVIVQGRIIGKTAPAWRESFELRAAVTANHQQPASINNSSISSPNASVKSKLNVFKSSKLTSILSFAKGTRKLANTGLLLGILLVSTTHLLTANKSQPTLWEYKIEAISDGAFDPAMHRMGSDGWEITSARRAVSGEGSSSQGLYEVIFKRPTTKAKIRENAKRLETEAKESALQLAQLTAKLDINSVNRMQQSTFLEKQAFATAIEELGLAVKSESENYTYSLTADQSKSLVTATAKTDELKSYTGAVFPVQEADGSMTTVAVICQTDAPSKTLPALPQLQGTKPVCPTGSSEVN